MQALLLAAGLGTRLRPHTLIRPKPLFPVLNRPLLHRLLDMLYAAGCSRIIVNCHHLAKQIHGSLEAYPNVLVQFEPDILGTGGSLALALQSLHDEPILVMNGDIVHTVDLAALYTKHCNSGDGVTLAMHDYPRFNTVTVQGNRVVSFQQEVDMQALAFTGIHVVEPEIVSRIPKDTFFHIIELYKDLAAQGRVGLQRVDGSFWRDIGTPEDYLLLHRDLLAGGTGMGWPAAGRKDGSWLLGEGIELGNNVQFQDWGCLGNGVSIGDGAVLRRSVVWDGALIPAGSELVDTIVTGE